MTPRGSDDDKANFISIYAKNEGNERQIAHTRFQQMFVDML